MTSKLVTVAAAALALAAAFAVPPASASTQDQILNDGSQGTSPGISIGTANPNYCAVYRCGHKPPVKRYR